MLIVFFFLIYLNSGSNLHKSVVIYLQCIAMFALCCFYFISCFIEQSLHMMSNPEAGERVVMLVKRK